MYQFEKIKIPLALSFASLLLASCELGKVQIGYYQVNPDGGNSAPANPTPSAQEDIITSWKQSLPLEFQTQQAEISYSSSNPQVAINQSGVAIITWQQSDGSNDQIFKSERAANGVWTNPTALSDNISHDGQTAYYPQVVINQSGVAIITWQQSDGSYQQIFKSERAANGVWTNPTSLSDNISPDGQYASNPQIAINDSGVAIITWYQSDGSSYQIFKSERATNGVWTNPTSLSDNISPDGQYASNPQVAINLSGIAIITWYQSDGSSNQVFKSERAVNGVWTNPTSLSDNNPNAPPPQPPQIAINDSGIAIITWYQPDGSNFQIFKSERAANGVWTNPTSFSDNISPDGQMADNPQIAINDSGIAIIIWHQSDGSSSQIFKSERAANGVWTNPTSLSDNISPDGQTAYYPQVAINQSGVAIITWQQSDGSNNQIFKSERAANGVWTNPTALSDNISPDGQSAYKPQVAINDSGIAIISWQQSDGSNNQIFKSERATNGVWTYPPSLSDNISPDGQSASNPQIAINDSGIAIITWHQSDGSRDQIFKSERAANGVWTNPTSLSDNISPDGQSATNPKIAINEYNEAFIVWKQADSKLYGIKRRFSGVWEDYEFLGNTTQVQSFDFVLWPGTTFNPVIVTATSTNGGLKVPIALLEKD